jgi:hypothetical protein
MPARLRRGFRANHQTLAMVPASPTAATKGLTNFRPLLTAATLSGRAHHSDDGSVHPRPTLVMGRPRPADGTSLRNGRGRATGRASNNLRHR